MIGIVTCIKYMRKYRAYLLNKSVISPLSISFSELVQASEEVGGCLAKLLLVSVSVFPHAKKSIWILQ